MICQKCKQDKSDDEFTFKNLSKGIKSGHCRPCKAFYQKNWYEKNKQKHIENTGKRNVVVRQELRTWMNKLKSKPCSDCKQVFHPECMDFDHLEDKKMEIALMTRAAFCKESIKQELKKCELVCANCHRLRTYKRRNGLVAQPVAATAS